MPTYTDVFGGSNIYPSELSYRLLELSSDVTLSWPVETSTNINLVARIIDVTASGPAFSVTLPDARKSGTGNTIVFNNLGANGFVVRNAAGVQVVTVAAGTVWQVYLSGNDTAGGEWKTFQFGATVSYANASALAGTGLVAVGALLSQSVPVTTFNSDYSVGESDRAKMYVWNGDGSGGITLPDASTVGDNWFMYLRNAGGGQVFAESSGTARVDALATKFYQPGDSSVIVSDGVNYYTLGFGRNSVFVFDYTIINIAGTGDYILAGSELNRIVYKFTGTLTGNRTVVIPSTVQQYWIDNSTVGPYTLVIKTATGQGAGAGQGARGIYYCDGANVVNADTVASSYPISVTNGGTGATSAGGALINLGGTALGVAIFTASGSSAVWGALGIAPAGSVVGGTF